MINFIKRRFTYYFYKQTFYSTRCNYFKHFTFLRFRKQDQQLCRFDNVIDLHSTHEPNPNSLFNIFLITLIKSFFIIIQMCNYEKGSRKCIYCTNWFRYYNKDSKIGGKDQY